jgi:vacuolar-type H+-ATPase subunit F/Vma7
MSGRCVFIGDEVSAAGFRLAGADCYSPGAVELPALFQRLRAAAGMILVTAEAARKLPDALLAEALREQRPPILVIADARGQLQPRDLAAALRRQLGLAE